MKSPMLELREVSKSYGALKATDGLSLQVRRGEIHALIGPNGAGKTTLIRQIYGSEKPDRGSIWLNGKDITRLPTPQRIRLGIGRSFQISSVLMDFTVLENAIIAEAAHQQRCFRFFRPAFADSQLRAGAIQMLEKVGLGERAGVVVGNLAHGERRLLELGLAMATRPLLLLLDEPMAGAGPEETLRMTRMIDRLREHAAILLVEHDMGVVFDLADHLTVLQEGRVIAHGTADVISADPAVREAYLGSEEN